MEVRGKFFSFEPESDNFQLLKKNIELNQAKNVVAIQKAVSNENESRFLYLSNENKGDHKIINLNESNDLEKVKIECTKLDDTKVNQYSIDLIKIDIQGAEMLALKGMSKILKNNPNMIILTELWPYGIEKSGYSPKEFFEKLEGIGFEISLIEGKNCKKISNGFKLLTDYDKEEFVNLICKRTRN